MKFFNVATISLVLFASHVSAAIIVPVARGNTISDWDSRDPITGLPNNWRIGNVAQDRTPSAAEDDIAIINSNRIIQVTTNVATVAGEVRTNNSNTNRQGFLEINSGGSLTTGLLRSTGSAGGNLTVQGTGSLTTAAAEINQNSSFTLIGSIASISAESFLVQDTAELNFVFDASGVFTLAATNAYEVQSGAALNIDGAAYTGGAGTISLISSGFRTGTQEFVENVSGFAGFATDVVYNPNGVDLILTPVPEPSALFLGSLSLMGVCLRRRR